MAVMKLDMNKLHFCSRKRYNYISHINYFSYFHNFNMIVLLDNSSKCCIKCDLPQKIPQKCFSLYHCMLYFQSYTFYLTVQEYCKGIYSSTVQSIFWLICFLTGMPIFRSKLLNLQAEYEVSVYFFLKVIQMLKSGRNFPNFLMNESLFIPIHTDICDTH